VKRPRPKYQVFISSTYGDLKEEREAVTWAILKARHIPVGMENFTSSNDRGWQTIKRVIDDSDYYVLIMAGRYGSVDETTQKSWTQHEYEYALSKGIPVLGFIRNDSTITADKMEKSQELREKLQYFVQQVKDKHLVTPWLQKQDLVDSVSAGLRNHIDDDEDNNPRPGWYRGDAIPSAAALEEFARLSTENARLQKELEEFRKAPEVRIFWTNGEKRNDLVVSHPHLAPNGLRRVPDRYWQYLARKNKTHWLSLAIENSGNGLARDVVVDFTIQGVNEIELYPEEPPREPYRDNFGTVSLPDIPRLIDSPSWKTDPKEHIYIDSYSVKERVGRVRYRIKSVTRGSEEVLPPIGLLASLEEDESHFKIEYKIAHADGVPITGQLTVTITSDRNRDFLAEEYAAQLNKRA
jgi:hypothetical protein